MGGKFVKKKNTSVKVCDVINQQICDLELYLFGKKRRAVTCHF